MQQHEQSSNSLSLRLQPSTLAITRWGLLLYDIKYFYLTQIIFNRSIWPIDGTQKCTTTLGQNRPRSNGKKIIFHTTQNWSLPLNAAKPYLGHFFGWEGVLFLCSWGYNQHVLSPAGFYLKYSKCLPLTAIWFYKCIGFCGSLTF